MVCNHQEFMCHYIYPVLLISPGGSWTSLTLCLSLSQTFFCIASFLYQFWHPYNRNKNFRRIFDGFQSRLLSKFDWRSHIFHIPFKCVIFTCISLYCVIYSRGYTGRGRRGTTRASVNPGEIKAFKLSLIDAFTPPLRWVATTAAPALSMIVLTSPSEISSSV